MTAKQWNTVNIIFLKCVLFMAIVKTVYAVRCFECKGTPFPRDCAKVVTCGPDEFCSVEQVVTTSGLIVYNSGCLSQSRCQNFLIHKKRGGALDKALSLPSRSTDIITCLECCTDSYCNNAGCGADAIPRNTRGPYCFTCKELNDPLQCEIATVCADNEQCLMFGPVEYMNHPDAVYRGTCENTAACHVLTTTVKNSHCPPYCCSDDFCNIKCGSQTNGSLTTPAQQSTIHLSTMSPTAVVHTTTTEPPSTTNTVTNVVPTTSAAVAATATQPTLATHPSYCPNDYYYDELSAICVKVVDVSSNYHDAQVYCRGEGDELVTIDSHLKMVFIETTLLHHFYDPSESLRYWIGAYAPGSGDKTFQWPNGQNLQYTYWGGHDEVYQNEQPDRNENQRCVAIIEKDHFMWHDDTCDSNYRVICEKMAIPTDGTVSATTVISTTTGHHVCDTQDGYELLQNQLCIKFHNQAKAWPQARDACKHEGGDLLVMDTDNKASIMKNKVLHNHQHSYWIGGNDFDKTNTFKWVDLTIINLNNGFWGPEQPNNIDGHTEQDCVAMLNEGHGWHDDHCDKSLPFICERQM
ncbi:uncharacterized protein LOC128223493 [Mya arenaria]|uniref:uncharacterized protein LOC128223493 n=1 Tax=Mya arenaria TaxID=6604 RepID=UPI0022DED124|nr:uncharacterized protein LOC128223493 [Mya arenaria]